MGRALPVPLPVPLPADLIRLASAAGAGALAALAFEPLAWWALLLPAVAILTLAVHGCSGRTGALVGLVFGLAFMLGLLPWLQVIGPDAWVGLSVLEAGFYALVGLGMAVVSRLPAWPVWASGLWVAVESARGLVPWGGFNWGRLAFAAVDSPLAPALPYVGTAGVSFLIVLAGTSLASALLATDLRARAAALLPALAAVCLPLLLPSWASADEGSLRVAAVQGNVPGKGMQAFAERRAVLDNHVHATLDLAARVASGVEPAPDLVIWPENSTDIDPFRDPTVFADIQSAVDAIGVPTLVGAMVQGPGPIDVKNEGIVWLPQTGPAARYAKTHPVPFGEYIPMRSFLAQHIARLEQIPRDMVPGTEPGLLPVAGTSLGDVICFEVSYDGLLRDVIGGGARLVVVQTNNATYMGTGQVDQQFAIARLRALETGRYVVVAATNGISAIVDPNGDVVSRAPERTQRVLAEDVRLLTGLTPAMRWGVWVEGGLAASGVVALLVGLLRSRRTVSGGRPRRGEPEGQLLDAGGGASR